MALQSQGNLVCLLRPRGTYPKGERQQEYGILAHNMEPKSECGTCIMTDGRYATMSWTNLDKAFKRIKEDTYKIPPLEEKRCQDLYVAAAANTTELKLRIKQSQSDHMAALNVAKAARAARLAQLKASKTAQTKQPVPGSEPNLIVGSCPFVVIPGTQENTTPDENGLEDARVECDKRVEEKAENNDSFQECSSQKLHHPDGEDNVVKGRSYLYGNISFARASAHSPPLPFTLFHCRDFSVLPI